MPPFPERKPAPNKVKIGTGFSAPVAPVVPIDTWKPQKVTIRMWYADGRKQDKMIDAITLGPLAIHKQEDTTPTNFGGYSITVHNIGYALAVVNSEHDARRIAVQLLNDCPDALSLDNREEVIEAIPDSVKDWIRQCRQEGTWVEPESIETEE